MFIEFQGMLPEEARTQFDLGARAMALAEVSGSWTELSESLEEMSAEFIAVLSFLAEAWQGTAAMTAVSKAMPYALWMATAGMECAGNGTMAAAQSANYEFGDAAIPQLVQILETRTEQLNSYAANAAAWGMLSGYVAECEGRMDEVTAQTMAGLAGYDGNTQATSVQFDFTPSPLITSVSPSGHMMAAATLAETMARAAAGVASAAQVDALLAELTLQVAEEAGLKPIRMMTEVALQAEQAAQSAMDMVQNSQREGLSEQIDQTQGQLKEDQAKGSGQQTGQQVMQIGQQVGQGIMQSIQQLSQFGQQAAQQVQQVGQQVVQQGQQIGQQIAQMAGHSSSAQTTFASPGLTGQYASSYSAGMGAGMTSLASGGSAAGGVSVPSGWGNSSAGSLGGAPGMSAMKLDAGALRGVSAMSGAASGSSLSSGGSGGGMGGQGMHGVATQAAAKKQSQEEEEEEANSHYAIPDQFADGRVVTPPVIGASERARA